MSKLLFISALRKEADDHPDVFKDDRVRKALLYACADEIDRLLAAIVRADLQIGDGHTDAARSTLHDAMN